jgi:predicted transcriptional regulator
MFTHFKSIFLMEEGLAELLFELSSSDRLTLLSEIKNERLRLTQLAQKLSATVQETSRHLERLTNAKLVEKDSAGSYSVTPFGKLALDLLPTLTFLTKNRDYLLSHDVSFLPAEFIQRIGDLSEHEYGRSVSNILRHVETVITEAKEYIWFMGDQILVPVTDQTTSDRNITWRAILPRNINPGELQYAGSKFKAKVELGMVDEIKVGIAMNEKIAGVSFPDLNGRIDMSYGFRASSPRFHKWCYDLFLYYWSKAKRNLPPQIRESIA